MKHIAKETKNETLYHIELGEIWGDFSFYGKKGEFPGFLSARTYEKAIVTSSGLIIPLKVEVFRVFTMVYTRFRYSTSH